MVTAGNIGEVGKPPETVQEFLVARNLVAHLDRQMVLAENFGAAEEIPGIVGKMRGKIPQK